MEKLFKHLKTVSTHKKHVRKLCFKMGLYRQGICHDLSKYSPTEFLVGASYYQGNRSPNNKEREETGRSMAWLHHKGRNKHHLEYWTDTGLNPGEQTVGLEIPLRYVAEMFCDRLAASKVYRGDKFEQGDPYKFFLRGKGRQLLIHPNTYELLEFILLKLQDEGEDATFEYIRQELLGK